MNRSDEAREVTPHLRGAALARTPEAARARQEREEPEPKATDATPEKGSEGASMAKSADASRSATSRDQSEQDREDSNTVRSAAGMPKKSVESRGVVGENQSVRATAAEGVSDDASARANRKEAEEPERERDEKAAIRENRVRTSNTISTRNTVGREPPTKGTMGHGQRTPVAKNTI